MPLGALLVLVSPPASAAQVAVEAGHEVARVPPGFYGAGYDGWGDLTDPRAVERLKDLPLAFIRIAVDARLICGAGPGEYHLQYATDRDLGVGFLDRVRLIRSHGWTPLLALTVSHSLPTWFHGQTGDEDRRAWFRFDTDGTYHQDGTGNQVEAWSGITRGLAAELREAGLSGLYWETIYELGHTMPLDDIHYWGARGIKTGDPGAKLLGPATWPGWTVEERFVKPYLAKYGPELLDYVSVHWYASNEHGIWATPGWGRPITMADGLWLQYLMEVTPKYEAWCRSLRRLLDDPQLNPAGRRIGIAFTELDANANSAYMQTPANPRHPNWDPSADCYVNTNTFGGVWLASTLCHLARSGCCDMALKFNTRQYYGLVDHDAAGAYMRVPVWHAVKLLSDVAGLRPGASLLQATAQGAPDSAAAHVGGEDSPWLECFAVKSEQGYAVVLLNRGPEPETADVAVHGLADGPYEVARYLFDAARNQRFIGRPATQEADGHFEPEAQAKCLEAVDTTRLEAVRGSLVLPALACPAVSLTVLSLRLEAR